jgi:hypothetical protein
MMALEKSVRGAAAMKPPCLRLAGALMSGLWLAVLLAAGERAAASDLVTFHVSPEGNDAWSGRLASRNLRGSDGPFATVAQALSAARSWRQSQPPGAQVVVCLRGGNYFLPETLVLTPQDSHTCFTAYRRERPVLSGGRSLSGWRQVQIGGRLLWTAEVPEARGGKWVFRELWVNGARATRARHPNKGYLAVESLPDATKEWTDGHLRFRYHEADLKPFDFLDGAEVVVMTRWVESRLPVVSVDKKERVLNFGKRSVFQLAAGDLYYVEGPLELLDQPGEWSLDSRLGKVYYFPRPGEDLSQFEAIAPVRPQVLRLEGEPAQGRFIENVEFRGITFAHAEWYFPEEFYAGGDKPVIWPPPKAEVGGFAQAAIGVPGAVWGQGVKGAVFDHCRFVNLGPYGLELGRGCASNVIQHCEFAHLGAGGLKLGETAIRSNPLEQSGGNVVTDCHIHHGGRMFHSAIGIWIGQSADNQLAHNLIHDFYYTGISIGWTWGYGPTLARGNLVAHNHVHHIGVQSDGDGPILSDMGGIYTLGMQPGTRILNNLWHDVAGFRYGGWGIYFDEGSSSILARSNVVYRTTHGGFHQHYGATNFVENNIFAFARDHQVQRSRPEPHVSFSFLTNIVYFDSGVLLGGNWSGDNYRLDYNLYYDARSITNTAVLKTPVGTWEQWRERGHDRNSRMGDPLFYNPQKGDFRLRRNSPAFELGFRAINLSKVGPRR